MLTQTVAAISQRRPKNVHLTKKPASIVLIYIPSLRPAAILLELQKDAALGASRLCSGTFVATYLFPPISLRINFAQQTAATRPALLPPTDPEPPSCNAPLCRGRSDTSPARDRSALDD